MMLVCSRFRLSGSSGDHTRSRSYRVSCNAAFSLVELIVAVTVISILLGLVLAGVQVARESARRISCSNSLRQLTLGLQLHHDTNDRFPAGQQSEDGSRPFSTWASALLPFVEQTALAGEVDAAYRLTSNPFDFSVHTHFATPVQAFSCASDGRAVEMQFSRGYWVGLTNYVGVAGLTATDETGCLYVDSKVRFRDITDGLSNTLVVGERPPSPDMYFGWWYAGAAGKEFGAFDTTLGTHGYNPFSPAHLGGYCNSGSYQFQPSDLSDYCGALHFWSLHPGGANFGFADGSVRFVGYSAADVVDKYATRSGAETW